MMKPGVFEQVKKADFVVLDQSPYDVGGAGLKDLEILATVFEGEVFPISGA
jgi:predicted amidohydrolase YtcJ